MKPDKIKHFIIGFVIALVMMAIFRDYRLALLTAGLAGAVKEVIDAYTPGRVEFLDFGITFIGGLFGCGIWWALS